MRVVIVTPKAKVVGSACRAPRCHGRILAGQAIVLHQLDTRDFADGTFAVHVDCLRAVLDSAPEAAAHPSNPAAEAAELRRALIAQGAR